VGRRFFYVISIATIAVSLFGAAAALSGSPARPTPIVVQTDRGGFAWADAAIGAAAAVGLVLFVAGVLFLKGDRNAD
jgi:hypothetical protein